MPRVYTRLQLRDRARQRADMVGSTFISDDEINSILSERYTALYDILVASGLSYFEKQLEITGTGVERYDLPEDFYGMVAVDYRYTINHFIPLWEYMPAERSLYENLATGSRFPLAYSVIGDADEPAASMNQISLLPALLNGQIARIRYIPAPKYLEDSEGATDATLVDGVSGWEEMIVVGAAIDMLTKEESSTTALERRWDVLNDRISSMAEARAWASPRRVVDTESVNDIYWWQYVRDTSTGGP